MKSIIFRGDIDLVCADDLHQVMLLDAKRISSDSDKYCDENEVQYYVLVNTWLMQIKEYSQSAAYELQIDIERNGLIPVIARCCDISSEMLSSNADELATLLLKDVEYRITHGAGIPSDLQTEVGRDPLATTLSLLRYPKRFSPVRADVIQQQSLQEFKDVEAEVRDLQTGCCQDDSITKGHPYNDFLVAKVADVIERAIPWRKVMTECKKLTCQDIEFSPGTCSDSTSSLGSKLMALRATHPEYFLPIFGSNKVTQISMSEVPFYGPAIDRRTGSFRQSCLSPSYDGGLTLNDFHEMRVVRPNAVPKSYKACRIITPCSVWDQGWCKAYDTVLRKYMPKSIPLTDQSVNQQMAKEGSIDGSFATIDLSHASDSISTVLGLSVLNTSFCSMITRHLPTHVEYANPNYDKTKPTTWRNRKTFVFVMQKLLPSGNALTFALESLIFWAIAIVSIELVAEKRFSPTELRSVSMRQYLSVYGDDTVIYQDYAETYMAYMELLGFTINRDKSYWQSVLYRESCGKEYLCGNDLTSLYFPRFPISGRFVQHRDGKKISINPKPVRAWTGETSVLVDNYERLISLQHKLMNVCPKAGYFLHSVVLESMPGMTTSAVGSVTSDLWAYTSNHKDKPIPFTKRLPMSLGDVLNYWRCLPWYGKYHFELRKCDGAFALVSIRSNYRADHSLFVVTSKKTRIETSVDVPEQFKGSRAKVMTCISAYDCDTAKKGASLNVYETWKYWNFLHFGPRYHDDWCRLARVSEQPRSFEEVFGKPGRKWTMTF